MTVFTLQGQISSNFMWFQQFNQYQSYIDFDFKLDGFIQIFAWTFD